MSTVVSTDRNMKYLLCRTDNSSVHPAQDTCFLFVKCYNLFNSFQWLKSMCHLLNIKKPYFEKRQCGFHIIYRINIDHFPKCLAMETQCILTSIFFKCYLFNYSFHKNRPCGLMVRVPSYRPEVRVRFPALLDFLRSSVSGTGSTQPREYNRRVTWKKK
jgi:hypothetical protein